MDRIAIIRKYKKIVDLDPSYGDPRNKMQFKCFGMFCAGSEYSCRKRVKAGVGYLSDCVKLCKLCKVLSFKYHTYRPIGSHHSNDEWKRKIEMEDKSVEADKIYGKE